MSELNSMRKRIKDLEAANENLTVQLQEEQNLHKNEMPMKSCKKDGKTVSSGYRKSIYHCLMNQVPVEFTGSLILNIVHEMTGSGGFYSRPYHGQPVCAYEVGVLNDIQVGEALEHGENMNIAWNATSLDAKHINEVHVNFSVEPHSTDRCVTGWYHSRLLGTY